MVKRKIAGRFKITPKLLKAIPFIPQRKSEIRTVTD
jgi:hypothetical protein